MRIDALLEKSKFDPCIVILDKIYYYQIVSDLKNNNNNTGDWVNEQNDGSTFKFEVFKPPKTEHFGWENFLFFI